MIHNPILPGFNPDPSILRVEDDYYIATSTFEWFPGIALYHSRDLQAWSLRGHALTSESDLDLRRLPSAKGVWAPCLSYADGLFYLAYSLMLSHNARYFDVDNFLISAPSIDGPWSSPVYLHSVGFDPSLFHDQDGRKYVACLEWELRGGTGSPGGIVVQEYDPKSKSMVGPLREVWRGGTRRGCVEGPHLYRRGPWYYLLCAEGGTGYGHCATMARAPSVWGPYEGDPENPILTATADFDELDNDDFLKPHRYNPDSPLQKVGHASLVETQTGEPYLAHLCARPFTPELRCTLGRETGIQRMRWTEDGWLRLASGGNRAQLEVIGLEAERSIPAGESNSTVTFEDFDGPWPAHLVSPRTSWSPYASLSSRPGFLRLRGQQSLCSQDLVSLVARRLDSIHAEVSCSLEFEPLDFRQSAGLVAYYDNMNHLFLRVCRMEESGPRLLYLTRVENGVRTEHPCAELPPQGAVFLRLAVAGRSSRFAYSCGLSGSLVGGPDGLEWLPAGPAWDTSELSDEYCKFGEFTGTFVGLSCVDTRSRSAIADYDWFEYRSWRD